MKHPAELRCGNSQFPAFWGAKCQAPATSSAHFSFPATWEVVAFQGGCLSGRSLLQLAPGCKVWFPPRQLQGCSGHCASRRLHPPLLQVGSAQGKALQERFPSPWAADPKLRHNQPRCQGVQRKPGSLPFWGTCNVMAGLFLTSFLLGRHPQHAGW